MRKHLALHAVTVHAEYYQQIPDQWRHLERLDDFGAAVRRAFTHGAELRDVAYAAGILPDDLTAEVAEWAARGLTHHSLVDPPALLGLDDVDIPDGQAGVDALLAHRTERSTP